MSNVLEIDGSYLEGGGQILRNALSLSCILRRPIRITKIRANRPNPGLANQHLYGLQLLQQICNAQVKGNFLKSTEVEFHPEKIQAGSYAIDTQTAASVSLVLQAALPVLLFANDTSQLELIGGTNVGMAPQVDFMTEVLRPNLERFGVTFDFDLFRRGYYPRGGGHCKITVTPIKIVKAVEIVSFGSLTEVCGWCYVAGKLPPHLANDIKRAAERELQQLQQHPTIEAYKESPDVARDNGSGIILKAVGSNGCALGAAGLGEKKLDAAGMGAKAAKELVECVKQGVCVDRYVQDQLILFMALAEGRSRIQSTALTDHSRTAIHVAELIAGVKFETVEEPNTGNVIITCDGLGYRNNYI